MKKELENTVCQEKVETEIEKLFKLRRETEKALDILLKLGGTGMFIDDFNPTIYRLRGILQGIDLATRAFDV